MNSLFPILRSTVSIMTPLLFAGAAGLFPALAGTLNIALEGLLLAGAFSALAVFQLTGNAALAVASAVCASISLSALHAFSTFKLRANIFITGLAINLLSSGLCLVVSDKLFGTKGVVAASKYISGILKWYFLGGLLLIFLSSLVIYKTPFGFRLRACDKNSDALLSLGISPVVYQTSSLLISGILCGIGGSFLSLNLGAFVPGLPSGKGWIALVVVFLGGRKPLGVLAAIFVFALADAFSIHVQGLWNIPADFILAFPYICTFIAMLAASKIRR